MQSIKAGEVPGKLIDEKYSRLILVWSVYKQIYMTKNYNYVIRQRNGVNNKKYQCQN